MTLGAQGESFKKHSSEDEVVEKPNLCSPWIHWQKTAKHGLDKSVAFFDRHLLSLKHNSVINQLQQLAANPINIPPCLLPY